MFSALAVAIGLLAPVFGLECGESIQDAVESGHQVVNLAGDCIYTERVVLGPKTKVHLKGIKGTRLMGQFVLEKVEDVRIEGLSIKDERVGVLVRSGGRVSLGNLRVEAPDGIQADATGSLALDHVVIEAHTGIALWTDGVENVTVTESVLSGGTYAMVLRRLPGKADIQRSHLRARSDSTAMAAVFVGGPGALSMSNNQLEYLTLSVGKKRSVLDLNIKGRIERNTLVGDSIGVRARRRIVMGCNRFSGTSRRIKGEYTRDCPSDLAPDRLDWRARTGTGVGKTKSP